jgi:hypothetical protein
LLCDAIGDVESDRERIRQFFDETIYALQLAAFTGDDKLLK